MAEFIQHLELFKNKDIYEIVACCCGHGKYEMSIVIKDIFTNKYYDLVSGAEISRHAKFYKRDSEGYYYIPEINKK
jgi:hypothetical protein